MARLRLSLEGPSKKVGLSLFSGALSESFYMLRGIDRAIAGSGSDGIDWLVNGLANGSALTTTVAAHPRGPLNDDHLGQVCAAFIQGLDWTERGEGLPPWFDDVSLGHLKKLSKKLSRNQAVGFKATYLESGATALLTEQSSARVDDLMAIKYKAIGSVIGKLELISLHKQRRFNVYDEVTRRPVKSTFKPEGLEKVKQALGRRVLVSGIVHRNSKGQPVKVEDSSIEILPLEQDLPSTQELYGIAPAFTGELSTGEYLARLADG